NSNIVIFYSSISGTTERLAQSAKSILDQSLPTPATLLNIDYLEDQDSYFVSPPSSDTVYLLLLPSYITESSIDFFLESLKETYNDFRIHSRPLNRISGYAVFGIGDAEFYADKFCYQAFAADKIIGKLGGKRMYPVTTYDVKSDVTSQNPIPAALTSWCSCIVSALKDPTPPEEIDAKDSDDEDDSNAVADLEDLGSVMRSSNARIQDLPKEMVASGSPTYTALTKQGYTIVGSHSGVKICRWTKSALRGRGSCYKFAFYGIKSHLCMETTPSLSCSSKCVFCWRHGTNPVGTTWRWQIDQPQDILKGAMEGHYKKIKQMRGVPGVNADRFQEAFTIKHCALSLVGEPIFYPHINEFVALLHARRISSFLVCNAQHPDELERMNRVTQLYVSIDAPDQTSLQKVDRPLHRDFWPRFQRCLDIIRNKTSQRTVFRLTLVKGFNATDTKGYADLIEKARPCFIEVKGVTYCGTSKSNPLTMANVPFYEEVRDFVLELNNELERRKLPYGIAAEHAHSCCILMAQNRFYINEVWHTHIDYQKFFDLLESGAEFGPMDYVSATPDWAHFGSDQAGFNPEDVRFERK
ncbi:hypothetical protein CANCADRAFT_18953, partial [Tortispora caseinolytica NRRL Y-17796]